MQEDIRRCADVHADLEVRMDRLEDAHRDNQRMFFGWGDEHGWHPGIVQVLSDGLRQANGELGRITSFFESVRKGGGRIALWILGVLGTGFGAGIWWIVHHLDKIAKLAQ